MRKGARRTGARIRIAFAASVSAARTNGCSCAASISAFEKLGFQHEHEAKAFLQDLQERLRKFELGLHPDKTRPIRFGRHAARECKARGEGKPETFDFLGFTHFCTRSKKTGGFVIGRKTIKKRMVAKLRALKVELRKRMHNSIAEANAAKASVSR